MSLTTIISAIGNTNKQYPLIVRDCGIEVPTKIVLTYNQNKDESKDIAKLAARERFLDEYAVSAVWLGGIPLMDKLVNYFIRKKGFNPDVNLKLFKENNAQGINLNIKNFEGKVSQSVINDLKKVKNNKAVFEKLLALKFGLSTTIPMLFMGVILPKLIFASSGRKIEKLRAQKQQKQQYTQRFDNPMDYIKNGKISFKGNAISQIANFSTVDKMAVTDGGYALGRVATARNKNEAIDVGFKMAGMLFLNFIAPPYLAKFLDKTTCKLTGLNVALDPIILDDKKFREAIKNKTLLLPKGNSEKEIIEFLDLNPKALFSKYAQQFCDVKYLENGIRDPRAWVNTKNVAQMKTEMEKFAKNALKSKDITAFAKKAKYAKFFNILTNIGVSSALLAFALPKAQFAFRKFITGSDLEPGLATSKDKI